MSFSHRRRPPTKQSRSSRAGLSFPAARVTRLLRKTTRIKRQSPNAGIYMAAVLEYLTAEVLELAGNAAKDNKKKRINPRYIMLAIKGDEELDHVFGKASISQGGVQPHIHVALFKKKKVPVNPRIKPQVFGALERCNSSDATQVLPTAANNNNDVLYAPTSP